MDRRGPAARGVTTSGTAAGRARDTRRCVRARAPLQDLVSDGACKSTIAGGLIGLGKYNNRVQFDYNVSYSGLDEGVKFNENVTVNAWSQSILSNH